MTETDQHTLIHVICDSCDEPDLLTIVEHPAETPQSEQVAGVHHTIAEAHADEAGHHVEVGVTEDDPATIVDLARSMAPSVGGVEPADFSEEMLA